MLLCHSSLLHLLFRLLAVGLLLRFFLGLCRHEAGSRQRLACQLEHTFDGAVHVAYLIDQGRDDLLCLEHPAGQHVVSDERTVLANLIVKILCILVELSL